MRTKKPLHVGVGIARDLGLLGLLFQRNYLFTNPSWARLLSAVPRSNRVWLIAECTSMNGRVFGADSFKDDVVFLARNSTPEIPTKSICVIPSSDLIPKVF